MAGINSTRKLIKDTKKFKKPKTKRYSAKASGAPSFRAIVTKKTFVEAKQPSSGNRKVIKVQILKNGKPAIVYVPGDGAIDLIQENDEVLVQGIRGPKGKTMGDIPVSTFKVISVNNMSLRHLVSGKKTKLNI